MRPALLLLLAGCAASPFEPPAGTQPVARTAAIDSAEAVALACGRSFGLTPSWYPIRYESVPWPAFQVEGEATVGYGGRGRVVIVAGYYTSVRLIAHEVAHAAFGWAGGLHGQDHDPRFRVCGLWPL